MAPVHAELQEIISLLRQLTGKTGTHKALTFSEAAAEFNIDETTLRDATNKKFNRLPHIGKGRSKKLIRHLIQEWIDVQATRN